MNTSNKNHRKFYFLSFVAIFAVSFVVLYPSFNLAFEDEEWQGIVLPKTIYENYITTKLTAYSSPMWFMTNLYTFLGPNFSPYFILSFILRNLLAFIASIFIYILTKNKLASFLGGVMIVVGFSGIQTTFEIINMISYISYIGYFFFLSTFFIIQDRLILKYLILIAISLLFSSFIASFRIYPLYAWVFLVDGVKVLMRFKKEIIMSYLIRTFTVIIVFLSLYKIGIFSWYTRDAISEQGTGDISRFISDTASLLTDLNFVVVLNFLKGIGNIIFPDILDKSGNLSLVVGVIYVVILVGLIVKLIKERTKDLYLLFAFFIWPLIFYACYFLVYLSGHPKESTLFQSYLRYQYPPFIGLSIALAILFSIVINKKNKLSRFVLGGIIAFIIIHGVTTHIYLRNLSKVRDGFYMVKIWKQINQLVPEPSLSTEKTNVFYFETDGSAKAIYTVNDGFIGHAIALYKIDSKPPKFDSAEISAFGKLIAPPIINYEELVSYINKSLMNSSEIDIWSRVFALRVQGERVMNIKEEVKMKVEASQK